MRNLLAAGLATVVLSASCARDSVACWGDYRTTVEGCQAVAEYQNTVAAEFRTHGITFDSAASAAFYQTLDRNGNHRLESEELRTVYLRNGLKQLKPKLEEQLPRADTHPDQRTL